MGMGEIRGFITLLTFISFLGVCWWAYRSSNRKRFEDDALLPFLDEAPDERQKPRPGSEGRIR
jgi:cytochrome c oxidase cbb3-type subunit 4